MSCFFEQYEIVTPPAALAVDLSLVKEHLKMDSSDASEDTYLTMLIKAVSLHFEKYTGRTLITTTYKTYLDKFYHSYKLRKAPNVAITTIKYSYNNVQILVPSTNYKVGKSVVYGQFSMTDLFVYPTNIDSGEPVEIIFTAGYGPASTDIPEDIRFGILNHVAYMYSNRGDCGGDCAACAGKSGSSNVYDLYRIRNVIGY